MIRVVFVGGMRTRAAAVPSSKVPSQLLITMTTDSMFADLNAQIDLELLDC